MEGGQVEGGKSCNHACALARLDPRSLSIPVLADPYSLHVH